MYLKLNKTTGLIIVGFIIIAVSIFVFTYSNTPIVLNSKELNSSEFKNVKIAVVDATFTGGAYNDAFYKFYDKYDPIRSSLKNVTKDVNLLTGTIPDHAVGNYNPWYESALLTHLNETLPGVNTVILSDQDVNRGLIFYKNGTNAYNLLILGHEEYVTQQEYDNFKNFVKNGGKIIFLDGNFFYAEVIYHDINNSVTLVKGHGYEFDGKIAKKSIFERWSDETSVWVGSNYYHADILHPQGKVSFTNNPFDAKFEDEENYVTNPNVRILQDYGLSDPNYKIATYELNYGKGNTIVLGIYGEHVINHTGFIQFFDSLVKGMLSKDPSSYNYLIPTTNPGTL